MNENLGSFFFFGTRVPYKVLEFMELEFHLNFFKELELMEFFFSFNFLVCYNSIV